MTLSPDLAQPQLKSSCTSPSLCPPSRAAFLSKEIAQVPPRPRSLACVHCLYVLSSSTLADPRTDARMRRPGDFFPPIFNCPHELDRLGALGDGGKWICGVSRIQDKPDCVVYSFGTSPRFPFSDSSALSLPLVLVRRFPRCVLFVPSRPATSLRAIIASPFACPCPRFLLCPLFFRPVWSLHPALCEPPRTPAMFFCAYPPSSLHSCRCRCRHHYDLEA